jgi:membrane-associated phospholipid phosphatase
MKQKIASWIGIIGTIICLILFFREPSFPTPDKLLVFLVFVFMIFNQAWDMLKHFAPFVAILLVYDSFRGLVPFLNGHVNYTLMPNFDKLLLGGNLPTVVLQQWLVRPYVTWYDYVFFIFYLLHFVLAIGMGVAIYKLRRSQYWRYAMTYVLASFGAFFIYLAFPAAPPWMASDNGIIPHITRVSSEVWGAIGITDFPSVYNSFAPNPVAAVPSLHAAFAILFAIFAFKYFGKKWGIVSLVYPFCIVVGVVYMGEHYVFDVITGAMLAVGAFVAAPYVLRWLSPHAAYVRGKVSRVRLRLRPAES